MNIQRFTVGVALRLAFGGLAMSMTTSPASAQLLRPSPPAAVDVATLLRTSQHAGDAKAILTQQRGPQSRARMDSVADTLVAFALRYSGNDPASVKIRLAAIRALSAAAVSEEGTPYIGAADRLLQIVEAVPSNGGGALNTIARLPNRIQAIEMMRRVAGSRSSIAYPAVAHLGNDMGAEGRAALRVMYEAGLVVEPSAKANLSTMAVSFGWARP